MGDFEKIVILQQSLEAARDAHKKALADIEPDLQAVTRTLELLRRGESLRKEYTELTTKTAKLVSVLENDLIAELRQKKTQLLGLIAIARRNGGVLATKDAKRLLLRSGLMKQTKNASNIIYNVIKRSERFKHVGSGTYRLVDIPVRATFKPSEPIDVQTAKPQ
ncbi:MAG: hypothetical protein ACLPVW_03935 [Terriglobales bacterium]